LRLAQELSEPMADPSGELNLVLEPAGNGTPSLVTDERLRRIEAALVTLALQQAAGPPPAGFQPTPPRNSVPLSLAVHAAQAAGYIPGAEAAKRRRWIDWPVIREIRLVSRMYVDPRYSPSRLAQVGVPLLIGLLILNYLFWRGWLDFTFVSPVMERLGVMVVAVVLYRILTAEMTRYAAVLDYLERSGRTGQTN
jgi:hypothetical protein